MAQQALAVIGAGYGDEGKGRTVDSLALALGPGTVVVRTNGGAQAGHTVVTPGGRRHVFHHLGSGGLAGAATHLSRFMVSHPMMLAEEVDAVARMGGVVTITADPRGLVTTPWDMMVNQASEAARGEARHGSCGLGFGETVGRSDSSEFALTIADLFSADLRDRLIHIRDQWLPSRLATLKLGASGVEFLAFVASEALLSRYLADCHEFQRRVRLCEDAELGQARALVFEAAQGLLLDQGREEFPFVTRSNTGLANMLELAEEIGVLHIDAYYVTRCYLTRHGRGPMPGECNLAPWFAIEDPTNLPNPWQETLRTGYLDPDYLASAIETDLGRSSASSIVVEPHLSISCLDQARDGQVAYLHGGAIVRSEARRFAQMLREHVGAMTVAESWGGCSRGLITRPVGPKVVAL
jgi:adenylosuccinate synthase